MSNNKKIGIATMTGGANYGNCLQNYAVQTALEHLGYAAYTLNNTTKHGFKTLAVPEKPLLEKLAPSYVQQYLQTRAGYAYGAKNDRDFHGAGRATAKAWAKAGVWQAASALRQDRFDLFRQCMIHTDAVPMDAERWDKEHLAEYFAFVCGSDQVWNPFYHTTSCVDFLQFAPPYKRVCFAPSFGVASIPKARRADYARWLTEILHLSVREQAGADIIKRLTGRDAQVLMDPTFCLTADEWRAFAREPQGEDMLAARPSGPYVLCYFLGNMNAAYQRWIETYAAAAGYQVVCLWDVQQLQYYAADPQEFIWLLDHAQAMFTDSFHGAALSINMEKPFVVFTRDEGGNSMNSRLETLLLKTGFEGRHYAHLAPEQVDDIDFTHSHAVLEDERARTFTYLRDAFACVKRDSQDAGKLPQLAIREHCTGCAACHDACPTSAITMVRDAEGFDYPVVESATCIGCKKCERACPADSVKGPAHGAGELLGVCTASSADILSGACAVSNVSASSGTGDASSSSAFSEADGSLVTEDLPQQGNRLQQGNPLQTNDFPHAYYAYAADTEVCSSSSSGGMFSLLANVVLAKGGVVYGAGYGEGWKVCHKRVANAEELADLRTSKYVQSDTAGIYAQVKEDLQAQIPVLFSGTPCQIVALLAYLKAEQVSQENLTTVDLICHGVPSPGVWDAYLQEAHTGKQIKRINFRDKTQGWNDFSMKVDYTDGGQGNIQGGARDGMRNGVQGSILGCTRNGAQDAMQDGGQVSAQDSTLDGAHAATQDSYRQLAVKDPFERAFLANLTLRPVCHQCQYKTVARVSDITLADYWGVELVHPELKEQQGVSLVLAQSEKGERLLAEAVEGGAAVLGETDRERATGMNSGAAHSVAPHAKRGEFFARWQAGEPFAPLVEDCLKPTVQQQAWRFIKVNGSRVKRLGRKVLGKQMAL